MTVKVDYVISGLQYDETTGIKQIKRDFSEAVKEIYASAKQQDVLRYNDVRPVLSLIAGVTDFEDFLINGERKNIRLNREEYPETGTLDFGQEDDDRDGEGEGGGSGELSHE